MAGFHLIIFSEKKSWFLNNLSLDLKQFSNGKNNKLYKKMDKGFLFRQNFKRQYLFSTVLQKCKNVDGRKSWMKGFALSDLSAGPGGHHQCGRRIGEKYCAQPILITSKKFRL